MAWYWIVLIVFAYLAIMVFTAVYAVMRDDDEADMFLALIFPIYWIVIGFYDLVMWISDLVDEMQNERRNKNA